MFYEKLKNPPNKYRPAPFWSWNERLDTEETVRQVDEMCEAGIGGYFMHARGGLQTEYLSDEWFDNVRAALREGKKLGMKSWGYDENGWPSGFGSGAVNGLGLKYQQKYLRCEETEKPKKTEHTVINIPINGINAHIYYEVNPFYVDTLDNEVVSEFLKSTHSIYKERLGDEFADMAGFFTDEPQISRNGYPWSFILEAEYKKAYGEELAPKLCDLFYDTATSTETKYRFFKLITDLFSESFMNNIYKWCKANGSKFTGHMVLEEGLWEQILANGACMPHYEYMDIPGMDCLCRELASIQCEMQLSSVANQLGKKQILSETFALCGWDVSFEDLRRIYEHQMVHGINYLCQHLEGYTLRGIRKRDYPATLFKQQPWWSDYKKFNDTVSRIGMLIAEGRVEHEVLVMHSADGAWAGFDIHNNSNAERLTKAMVEDTMRRLEQGQIQYHLGDSTVMKRHARVENGRIVIGTQKYSVAVIPACDCLSDTAFEIIRELKAQGGTVIFNGEVPYMLNGKRTDVIADFAAGCIHTTPSTLVDAIPEGCRKIRLKYNGCGSDKPIITAVRRFDEQKMTMYYLVNPTDECCNVTATVKAASASAFNAVTGDETPVVFSKNGNSIAIECTVCGNNSAVLFAYDEDIRTSAQKADRKLLPLDCLKGEWKAYASDNTLTLDYCDVYFDGELKYRQLPVSDVQEKALAYGRSVKTETVFTFDVREAEMSVLDLVVETPEIFKISVNGQPVEKNVKGYFCDSSFKVIDIKNHIKCGLNEISLTCDFVQSDEVYENYKKSLVFESEKNKLSYDMEIEAIYIKGDFAVRTDEKFEHIEKRGIRTNGRFYITSAPKTLSDGSIAEQGYPFFAGEMTFKRTVTLSADEVENRSVRFSKLCSTVTKVKVNGSEAGEIMWKPYEVDLSGLLKTGENEIEITVTGNLRNLLGPFHLKAGEWYYVGPGSFFHESPTWVFDRINGDWVDSYCFVEFGLFF